MMVTKITITPDDPQAAADSFCDGISLAIAKALAVFDRASDRATFMMRLSILIIASIPPDDGDPAAVADVLDRCSKDLRNCTSPAVKH